MNKKLREECESGRCSNGSNDKLKDYGTHMKNFCESIESWKYNNKWKVNGQWAWCISSLAKMSGD